MRRCWGRGLRLVLCNIFDTLLTFGTLHESVPALLCLKKLKTHFKNPHSILDPPTDIEHPKDEEDGETYFPMEVE